MSDNLDDNNFKPREKLAKIGGENLSSVELLAIILQTGYKNSSAVLLSQTLLLKYKNFSNFLSQSMDELLSNKGIGMAKATKIKSIYYISLKIKEETAISKNIISNAKDAFECVNHYSANEEENVFLICLNINNELIAVTHIFKGSLSSVMISPREIFKIALKENSKKIYIIHNHPSGNLTPSSADVKITEDLIMISEYLDLKILDHLIISNETFLSFKEDLSLLF